MTEDLWFKIPRPRTGPRLRMFVFHHAGGSSSSYTKWADQVPREVELVLVELPGRASRYREPFYTEFGRLIEELGKQISSHLDVPYVFFGHSMGSLVGFQLIGWLERHRKPLPALLVVSAFGAPTAEAFETREKIGNLDEPALVEKLKLFGELPKEVAKNDAYLRFYLSIIRADIQLLESCPQSAVAPITVPILALFSDNDPSAKFVDVQKWERFTDALVTTKVYPGDHFYLFSQSQPILDSIFQYIDSENLLS